MSAEYPIHFVPPPTADHTSSSAATPCASASNVATGNIEPLLHEVRHALARWLDDASEHAIDLRGMPMAPGEEDQLLELLGRGEVVAEVTGLGRSEVVETHFPGVWLITHYGHDEQIIGRLIEIGACPALLKTQPQDAEQALQALEQHLSKPPTGNATRLESSL